GLGGVFAARLGGWGAVGGRLGGGYSLRRDRDRALALPDPAPASLAPRGRADRRDPAERTPRRGSARACRAGPRGRGGPRGSRVAHTVCSGYACRARRPRGAAPRPDLAPGA